MNEVKKRKIEILLLIMISFSPLLSNFIKAILTLFLFIFNFKYIKNIMRTKLAILVFTMFSFLLYFIYDYRNVNELSQMSILNLFFPLCFLVGFIISQKYDSYEYLYYLDRIIYFLGILSLIGVFLYSFLPNIVYLFPSYNYYNTSHKTAFVFNVLLSDIGVIRRNAGIAWEPGVFQFLLNIGLYSYILLNKKVNYFKVCLYAFIIFTTKSTAGLILLIIILSKTIKENKKILLPIIVISVIFINPIREELIYQYNYKLVGSLSFEGRLEPMIRAFRIGLSNPFGLGNTGYDFYYESLGIGAWDSYGQIVARYGYIMLLFIVFLLTRVLRNNKVLFLVLAITFSSQGIWYMPIITPFYYISIIVNEKNTKEGLNENIMGSKYTLT